MAARTRQVSFLFCLLVISCSQPEEIKSPVRKVNIVGPYVTFEGRWRSILQTGSIRMPTHNTVFGDCYRETKTCQEIIARLHRKGEWLANGPGFLYVTTTEFQIVEWSNARIVARYEAPVADIEIRISLSDRSVERSDRETKARGSDTADPKNAGHWVLE